MVHSDDNATVTDNTVSGNLVHGIHVESGDSAMVTGNTVTENGVGIYIAGFGGTAKVNYNNVFSNAVGLQNNTGNDVDATNNWWGPGGTGANAAKPGEGGNNGVVNSPGSTTVFTPWSKVEF